MLSDCHRPEHPLFGRLVYIVTADFSFDWRPTDPS
jgi:hypothetical protein